MGKKYPITINSIQKDDNDFTVIDFSFTVRGRNIAINGVAKLDEETMKYVRQYYSNVKGFLMDEIRNELM